MAAESKLLLHDVACEDGPGPRALRATLRVAADHPILAGHFPGAPLVPGVLLLEAVRLAGERALGRSFRTAEVLDVRFTQPVAADQPVSLRAVFCIAADGDAEIEGEWHGDAGRIATFRLRLAAGRA